MNTPRLNRTQFTNRPADHLSGPEDFFFGLRRGQGQAQGASQKLRRDAHGFEYVAFDKAAGRAGGTCGRLHPVQVQQGDQGFIPDARNGQVQMARQMMLWIAVDDHIRDLPLDRIQQDGPQPGQAGDVLFRVPGRFLQGGGHAGGGRHVFRGGSETSFLLSPVDQRFNLCPFADIKEAGAFRPAELMGGQGQEVRPRLNRQARIQADRLHGVGVHRDAVLQGNLRDFTDRLRRADLVVGRHDGNELRVRPHGPAHVLRIDPGVFVRADPGDSVSLFFQESAGVQQGGMLDRRGDQVSMSGPETGHHALDRPVVAFAAAGGKINLFRAHAHAPGNVPPRLFQPRLGPPSGLVEAGCVPPAFPEAFCHRRKRRLRQRRRRRVIQIHPLWLHLSAFPPGKILVKKGRCVK